MDHTQRSVRVLLLGCLTGVVRILQKPLAAKDHRLCIQLPASVLYSFGVKHSLRLVSFPCHNCLACCFFALAGSCSVRTRRFHTRLVVRHPHGLLPMRTKKSDRFNRKQTCIKHPMMGLA